MFNNDNDNDETIPATILRLLAKQIVDDDDPPPTAPGAAMPLWNDYSPLEQSFAY